MSGTSEKKHPIGQIALAVTALGIAFWAGHMSSSDATTELKKTIKSDQNIARGSRRAASYRQTAGAGEKSISTAHQLRNISTHEGSTATVLALAKMNSGELSELARDILAQNAVSPSGALYSEIYKTFNRWAEIDPTAALQFALSSKQSSFKNTAAQAVMTTLAKTDPQLAREEIAKISDPGLRWTMKNSLSRTLATSDPQTWLQEIKSDPALMNQTSLKWIAQKWALEDPVNAANLLKQSPDQLQLQGIGPIGQIWASKDPQAALAWAQSLSKTSHRNKALSAVLGGMASNDPNAALSHLDSLSAPTRRAGVTAIFKTLFSNDFDTALSKAQNLTNTTDQKAAFEAILKSNTYYGNRSGMTAEQLSQLTKHAPNQQLRNRALDILGSKLSHSNPEEADAILQIYPGKEQTKIKLRMISQLSYLNPMHALKLYQSLPSDKVASYTFSSITSQIAKTDPDAALDLVLKEKRSSSQTRAMESVYRQLTENDPENAQQRLNDIPKGPLRAKAIKGIAETWAKSDPNAAMQWASNLPEKEQNKAVLAILPEMAKVAPEDAANQVKSLIESTPKESQSNLSSTVYYVMDSWSKTDPAAAGDWVTSLEEGSAKSSAMGTLASNWYQEDSDAVADWIDNMPQGKNRDSSVSAIANSLRSRDPATAFAWADSIGDDKRRIRELRSLVRTWKNNDPDKALNMVEKTDLSAEERTSLMQLFEKSE